MNKQRIIYIIIAVAIIAAIVLKLKNNKSVTEAKVYRYDKTQTINVQADTIKLEFVNANNAYTGTFEPNKESKISAEVQGKINAVLVDIGSNVRKGQSLIQLDNSLLKLQLQTLNVQVEGLEADVNRYTILANADAIQGVQLEKAILGLKAAKVQRATLQEQISKTTVRAPFNGVVTAKLTEEGAFAAPGVPLLQITDIRTLKFTISVPENDLNQFSLNQNFTIYSDAYPDISLNGKTTMVGSKANMGNSFQVQFSLNNTADLKIKSGMFGKVNLNIGTEEKGIIIPAAAIISKANQAQVYVVKNGKAILQNVTIAKKIQNNAVVSNGLNEGDVIVTNGFINLFDGANISIKN
ncbi:MAG: efflux RND transporter periplasmic adaptor subunit [Chitinophagaceae bacterium]|nr:efflux RND transporter periplasmic adaptor subunit [Chitinophagaceae bacterium]